MMMMFHLKKMKLKMVARIIILFFVRHQPRPLSNDDKNSEDESSGEDVLLQQSKTPRIKPPQTGLVCCSFKSSWHLRFSPKIIEILNRAVSGSIVDV